VLARRRQSLPARGARLALVDLLLASEDLVPDVERGFVADGDRLIKHARDWSILAEIHLTRRLLGALVRRIAALPVATG